MKISLNWLGDFVTLDPKVSRAELVARVTASTAEVEHVEELGANLKNIVVGYVRESKKHPNADKLTVNKIEGPKGKIYPVVCGAPNMRQGLKVIFALPGAYVRWHGEGEPVLMAQATIRGETSEGMACAAEEIGLAGVLPQPEGGIVELPMEAKVGMPLAEYLGMSDTVLTVDNHAITHRADLFSHRGMAREVAALGLGKWHASKIPAVKGTGELPFKLKFAKDVVRGYAGVVVSGVSNTPSPKWMRERLEACGIRSLGVLIDVTNYTMLELGIPQHAFDLAQLRGKKLDFRLSKAGEKVRTLDGILRTLPDNVIVADDGEKIIDLCGIMGGESSGITEQTQALLVHVPVYEPVLIRRAMIALKHRTDAGTIYEKGVDAHGALESLARTVQILRELFPQAKVTSKVFEIKPTTKPKSILVKKEYLEKFLGTKIATADMKRLTQIGFQVSAAAGGWRVTPPTWRGETKLPAEIAEEVIRLRGFETLTASLPQLAMRTPERNPHHDLSRSMRTLLCGAGYDEVLSYSLVGQALLTRAQSQVPARDLIEITNAVSEDFAYYRPSLLPRILEVAERNLHAGQTNMRLWEIGRAGWKSGKDLHESQKLMCLLVGEKDDNVFYSLKGVADFLLARFSVEAELVEEVSESLLHPARQCGWKVGGKLFGTLGELHPSLAREFDIRGRAAVLEFDLDLLVQFVSRRSVQVRALPRFPGAARDIAVLFGEEVRAGEVLAAVRQSSGLLRSAEIFDIYQDAKLREAKQKSLAFRLEYLDESKTLTEAEVNNEYNKAVSIIREFGGTVRA